MLETVKISKPEWQPEVEGRVAGPGGPVRAGIWVAWVAAAVVTAGAGWWAWDHWIASDPARLIAKAYARQRPFEFRIAGAAHGQIRTTVERTLPLVEAEARIKRELKKNPDSSEWLTLYGRAEMLERDPEAAIATLTRALDDRPADPGILADLGLAYALRAESADRAIDYGFAIDYLKRSLKEKPDVPEVVFNLALTCERMFLYDLSIEEWRHILRLERSAGWSGEAHGHLRDLERKTKARKDALKRVTDDPLVFLSAMGRQEVNEPESYLDIALTRWLPNRFNDAGYERALQALAAKLQERHGDPWLADALAARRSDGLVRGLVALAAAVQANQTEQTKTAVAKAREASMELRAAGDSAGYLRAEVEHIYALHRSYRAVPCVKRAMALDPSAASRGYSWILSQARLETGICRGILGDSGGAVRDDARAVATARAAGYHSLELRAEGILAGTQTLDGNRLVAWDVGRGSLARFWQGVYPGIRAQQIHDNLRRACEDLGLPHAAYAFARSAVIAIAEMQRPSTEAINRAVVASLAWKTGSSREAEEQFETAEKMFRELRNTTTPPENYLYSQIWHAEAQVATGAPGAARERLNGVREDARRLSSQLMRMKFYGVAGDSAWLSGYQDEAETSWRETIRLVEQALSSLHGFEERANAVHTGEKAYRGAVEAQWGRPGDEVKALHLWEWFRSAEQHTERLTMGVERKKLRSETVLSFADLLGGLVMWVFDDQGVRGRRLSVRREELELTARRFARLCADPASSQDALRRDGRQLYDWLIAPVAQYLDPARTLVFEPDEPVAAIPWAALLDRDSRYLGERFSTVVAGGVADYLRRATVPSLNRQSGAVIVADPALGEDMLRAFPPLRQARREAQMVAARFPRSTVLAGRNATLNALERAGRVELLHFAGHGFSHAGNGGLLLAQANGVGAAVLDAKRLPDQDWTHCRLAVLSACSTGTGETRGPVNPESLVRRLLWAGVARVVASRWNVDSETSVQLMDDFYSALLAGRDVPAALRESSERLRQREATRHPYYWAGFQTFGTR